MATINIDARTIAIVGVGPRGLNILARVCEQARADGTTTKLILVDPSDPGSGAHDVNQPDHLIANTVSCQITMFEDDTVVAKGETGFKGPNFYEWAKQEGHLYRNYNSPDSAECPREVQPNDYLPRALLGKYLQWTFTEVLKRAPQHVTVEHIRQRAVDMEERGEQQVAIQLQDGNWVEADYVFLTTGHGKNTPSPKDVRMADFVARNQMKNPHLAWVRNPYPVNNLQDISSTATVAVQGTGLTATDIVSELTIGRGGRFTYDSGADGTKRATYHKSGDEPAIYVYSRSGAPFGGRGVNQKGCEGKYIASWLTDEAVDKLRAHRIAQTGNAQLDFEADIVPLLKKEMAFVYRCRSTGAEIDPGSFEPTDEDLAIVEELLHPRAFAAGAAGFKDLADYKRVFLDTLRGDIAAAWQGNVDGAAKAAADVIRDVRGTLRYLIDYAGLTPESHHVMLSKYGPVINRVAVGPPMERNLQFLALIEAGVLQIGIGPSPTVSTDEATGTFQIKSQFGEAETTVQVDVVVLSKLDKFYLDADSSALMRNLHAKGTLRPFYHQLGGIDVDKEQHPITAEGRILDRVWALGNLVEGANYYTYILPRPLVQSRALCDAKKLVESMVQHADSVQQQTDCRLSDANDTDFAARDSRASWAPSVANGRLSNFNVGGGVFGTDYRASWAPLRASAPVVKGAADLGLLRASLTMPKGVANIAFVRASLSAADLEDLTALPLGP